MAQIIDEWSQLESKARRAYEEGKFSDAEHFLLESLQSAQEHGSNWQNIVDILGRIAFIYEKQGNRTGAKEFYQKQLKLLQEESESGNPQIPQILEKLAYIHKSLGNDKAYEQFLARAAEYRQEYEPKKTIIDGIPTALNLAAPDPAEPQRAHSKVAPHSNNNHDAQFLTAATLSDFGDKPLVRHNIPPIDSLVTQKERTYYILSMVFGVTGCIAALLLLWMFLPFILLMAVVTNGLYLGGLRGNSMRISPKQLPELYKIIEEICATLSMDVPNVYVSNGEGQLNAFAIRLLSRDFVVIYSNILELAFEKGEAEVTFVLAHELAHIKRKHTKWVWVKMPSHIVPFLSNAYSRACETTCDQIAAAICPEGARWGLVALAAGSKVYRRASLEEFYQQYNEEHGFWTWFYEILSTHPNLVKRIKHMGITANNYDDSEEVDDVRPVLKKKQRTQG